MVILLSTRGTAGSDIHTQASLKYSLQYKNTCKLQCVLSHIENSTLNVFFYENISKVKDESLLCILTGPKLLLDLDHMVHGAYD